jgi:hypothetical protein
MMGLALTTGSPGVRPWLSKAAAPRLRKTPCPAAGAAVGGLGASGRTRSGAGVVVPWRGAAERRLWVAVRRKPTV